MAVNKLVVKVDGVETKTLDFMHIESGLADGAHTITVEAYDGATLVNSQTRNFTTSTAAAFEPEYQAVLDYATTNAIPLPNASQQAEDNQQLIDIKATGAWSKIDGFAKFEGTADPAFKLIDWKRLTQMSGFGTLGWDTAGVWGNQTNAYINTHYTPLTDAVNMQLNNAGIYYKSIIENDGSGVQYVFGGQDATTPNPARIANLSNRTNNTYIELNQTPLATGGGAGLLQDQGGLNGLQRSQVNQLVFKRHTQVDLTYSSSATKLLAVPIFIFASNFEGTEVQAYGHDKIGYMFWGASLEAEFDTLNTIL